MRVIQCWFEHQITTYTGMNHDVSNCERDIHWCERTTLDDGKYPKAVNNVVKWQLYETAIMALIFYTQPETQPED